MYCSCFCPLKLTIFSRVEENEDWVKVMDSIVSVLTGTVVQNRQVPLLLPIQTLGCGPGFLSSYTCSQCCQLAHCSTAKLKRRRKNLSGRTRGKKGPNFLQNFALFILSKGRQILEIFSFFTHNHRKAVFCKRHKKVKN
jgi:hypothetical protein